MDTANLLLFGLVSSVIALLLGKIKSEYAMICTVCAAIILLMSSLQQTKTILDFMGELQQKVNLSSRYYGVILKGLGLCILTEFATAVASDYHQTSLAQAMGFLCRVSLIALSLPVFQDVLQALEELLK